MNPKDKSKLMVTGDEDVTEEEKVRMRKVREKLARKKWVFDSEDEESSSGDDTAEDKSPREIEVKEDKKETGKLKRSGDLKSPRRHNRGKKDAGAKKNEKEEGKKKGEDGDKNISIKTTAPSPRTPGEEKSIEYLLKKYYSKETLTDDLVKVGDKWVRKDVLEKQKQEEEDSRKKRQEDEKKQMPVKKLPLQHLDGTATDPPSRKKKEKGKNIHHVYSHSTSEPHHHHQAAVAPEKAAKKITSPPVSPRSPRGLLSFSKEKRGSKRHHTTPSPPSSGHKEKEEAEKGDKGANNPPPSPATGKRPATQHPQQSASQEHNRKRAQTQGVRHSDPPKDGQDNDNNTDNTTPNGSKRPSSAELYSLDLEDGVVREREKNRIAERRRSMGLGFLSSADDRLLRGSGDMSVSPKGGDGDPKHHRWSGDYGHQSGGGDKKKEDSKKKISSVKFPDSVPVGKEGKKGGSMWHHGGAGTVIGSGSGGTTSVAAGAESPPPAPPPPKVSKVPQTNSGKTLARELSEMYCYSDRRDLDFREEMLEREKERKKLMELKKDIRNSEKEYQRKKKDRLKDENKKAKWGLLFSLPQDIRNLKMLTEGEGGVVVDTGGADDSDDEEDDCEGDAKLNPLTKEAVEERVRLLNLHLERTISQLLLENPEEGERLLARKQEEEEKRKRALEQKEKEEEEKEEV